MGASGSSQKQEILFSAYKSVENNINNMREFRRFSKDVYLINAKTISNFISIIKKYYGNEKKLKKHFGDYELETNIKVFSNYKECKNAIDKKQENEFIIVDKAFMENMGIRDYDNKSVELQKEDKSKIYFPISHYDLNIRKKDNEIGIYEFYIDEDEINYL
mgnify:CR=1 FL=1